jgi:Arc/MetJ-type ribon-helix-helix transcriptional regulator
MGSTKRTTLRLTDERKRLLERANDIVADGPHDDPPNSEVIDAALTHLIESEQNIESAREELDPTTIQEFNTSVLGLRYRTSVESRWR